jgi:hypothetical protein
MVDGGLEDWIDANNLRYWTEGQIVGGGRVTRDVGAYQGNYCARLHYVFMDTLIGQQRTLQKEREYRMRFYSRCPGTMGSDYLELWIFTQFVGEMMPRYLQWDGSWENGGFIIVPVFNSWEPFEQFFTLPAQSNGTFGVEFHWAFANDCLVDVVTLRLTDASRQIQIGDQPSLVMGNLILKLDRIAPGYRIQATDPAERIVRTGDEGDRVGAATPPGRIERLQPKARIIETRRT